MPQLSVAFASDTEDNYPSYVPQWRSIGSNYDANPGEIRWDWSQYWGDLSGYFKRKDVPVTWLVRVDDGPIRDQMIELFRNEILELRSSGDEVGIHIHSWSWGSKLNKWVQTKDPKREGEIVHRSIRLFQTKLGFAPSSVRMGWNAMSNEIMRALEEGGLKVDSSAIPGVMSFGKFGGRDNIVDWSRAPRWPYHPSYKDYQSQGDMKILELPISTIEADASDTYGKRVHKLINKFSHIKGSHSLARLLPIARILNLNPHYHFYVSPSWSLSVNLKIINKYYKEACINGDSCLIGYFHASDILDPVTKKKNIIFDRYINKIIKEISMLKEVQLKFTTLSEIANNYEIK